MNEHDYIMKLPNTEKTWELIQLLRAEMKRCGSKYTLRPRGRKPKGKWGIRPSIPLKEAQELAIYVRRRDYKAHNNEQYEERKRISEFYSENATLFVKRQMEQILQEL